MATNVTIRLPWHMNGWNGTLCKDPKGNTYCSGRFSYPGDAIATTKDEAYEVGCAGKHCGQLDTPPPCALSCNVFGSEAIRCQLAGRYSLRMFQRRTSAIMLTVLFGSVP